MVRGEENAPYGGHTRSIPVRLTGGGGGLGLLQGLEHLLQGCHQGAHSARLLHVRVQHHPDVDGIVLVRQQAHQGGVFFGEEGGEQGDAEPCRAAAISTSWALLCRTTLGSWSGSPHRLSQ